MRRKILIFLIVFAFLAAAKVFISPSGVSSTMNTTLKSNKNVIDQMNEAVSETKEEATSEKVITAIGCGEGRREAEVIIPVSFNKTPNKGIGSCDFKLQYDYNVLDVIEVTPGDIVVNSVANFSYAIDSTTGTVSFLFIDNTYGEEPITKEGVFANIKFKVKKNAAEGITSIKLKSVGAFADHLLQEHDVTFEEGNINVY